MKVQEFCNLMKEAGLQSDDARAFLIALERFNDLSLSVVTEKLAKMKVPKVDPAVTTQELAALFRNSSAFERRISEMASDRNYTKAVFQTVFSKLFPNIRPPAQSIKKDDLIDRIRRERRRAENLATA